jgi:acyl dehydratase
MAPSMHKLKLFYYDELSVGQRFRSATTITMDKDRIISFATEFDPQPFHLGDEGAKDSLFASLAASGWHTAAATMRLLTEGGLPIAGGIIASSIQLNWPKPTRPGDELHVESEILEITPSKTRPDRATITTRSDTFNQRSEILQTTIAKLVGSKRPT